MPGETSLKPVVWIGSSRTDLRAFPEPVQDHMGYALYIAQRGGKHRDTKTLSGFGGAGMVEVIKDFAATRSGLYTRCGLRRWCTSFTPSRRNPRRVERPRAKISS